MRKWNVNIKYIRRICIFSVIAVVIGLGLFITPKMYKVSFKVPERVVGHFSNITDCNFNIKKLVKEPLSNTIYQVAVYFEIENSVGSALKLEVSPNEVSNILSSNSNIYLESLGNIENSKFDGLNALFNELENILKYSGKTDYEIGEILSKDGLFGKSVLTLIENLLSEILDYSILKDLILNFMLSGFDVNVLKENLRQIGKSDDQISYILKLWQDEISEFKNSNKLDSKFDVLTDCLKRSGRNDDEVRGILSCLINIYVTSTPLNLSYITFNSDEWFDIFSKSGETENGEYKVDVLKKNGLKIVINPHSKKEGIMFFTGSKLRREDEHVYFAGEPKIVKFNMTDFILNFAGKWYFASEYRKCYNSVNFSSLPSEKFTVNAKRDLETGDVNISLKFNNENDNSGYVVFMGDVSLSCSNRPKYWKGDFCKYIVLNPNEVNGVFKTFNFEGVDKNVNKFVLNVGNRAIPLEIS